MVTQVQTGPCQKGNNRQWRSHTEVVTRFTTSNTSRTLHSTGHGDGSCRQDIFITFHDWCENLPLVNDHIRVKIRPTLTNVGGDNDSSFHLLRLSQVLDVLTTETKTVNAWQVFPYVRYQVQCKEFSL